VQGRKGKIHSCQANPHQQKPAAAILFPSRGRLFAVRSRPRCERYGTFRREPRFSGLTPTIQEETMGFGRGLLLWLLGIPLPIIILLALFWHN
jgi:hypothetical protein